MGDAGFTYVDEMGQVYYETAVWRQIGEQIGSVMIWFSYDAEENCFNVSDYFYCKIN